MLESKKCTCLHDLTKLDGDSVKKAKEILYRKSNKFKDTEITHSEIENTSFIINRETGQCDSVISLNMLVTHTKAKRPTPISIIASYCPFCGCKLR